MKVELKGLEGLGVLSGLSEWRMSAALATAMTRTAYDVRAAEQDEMRRVFDRPRPWVVNAVRVSPATVQRMRAEVGFKDDGSGGANPTNVLRAQVDGGQRRAKRLEASLRSAGHLPPGWFCVPGAGAQLDATGDMTRGQVIQILSQLRVQMVGGFDRAMSQDARKQINAQRRAGGRFFVMPPGKRAAPGVYQREFGAATGTAGRGINARGITPVVMFVRSVQYRQRFDFDGVALRTVDQVGDEHITRAVMQQVDRARRPGTQGDLW
jgi:hypothetical protein